jgi:large subunit ribosomal protein L23
MKTPGQVIQRPLVSEKSYGAMTGGKYVFRVWRDANKQDIAQAVAEAFKVDVVSVNTMHMRGKERRRGKLSGFQPDWKKAVVTLKEGQKIENLFQGV